MSQGEIFRNIGGKMVKTGLCGDHADAEQLPIAVVGDESVIFKLDPKKNYKVDIKPGKDGKFYWSRIHRGKVRSIGGQGFASYKKAQADEQFDADMMQTGVGALQVED